MFYEWIYPLHKLHGLSALNVFRYITFRSAYAAITALILCFVLGPPLIQPPRVPILFFLKVRSVAQNG